MTSTVQAKPEAPAPAPIVHTESAAKGSTSEADPPKS
jgi:hypothetical protein